MMDIKQLSQKLGISESGLYQWVSQRRIPFLKIGRSVRFDDDEIKKWLEERRVAPRSNSRHLVELGSKLS